MSIGTQVIIENSTDMTLWKEKLQSIPDWTYNIVEFDEFYRELLVYSEEFFVRVSPRQVYLGLRLKWPVITNELGLHEEVPWRKILQIKEAFSNTGIAILMPSNYYPWAELHDDFHSNVRELLNLMLATKRHWHVELAKDLMIFSASEPTADVEAICQPDERFALLMPTTL